MSDRTGRRWEVLLQGRDQVEPHQPVISISPTTMSMAPPNRVIA